MELTTEEYTALASLARDGSDSPEKKRVLEQFLLSIERRNKLNRYFLVVQWQETNYPLPPTTQFPEKWPPELRLTIERTDRPIARVDVENALKTHAKAPIEVLVTKDPGQLIGWTPIDDFFIT